MAWSKDRDQAFLKNNQSPITHRGTQKKKFFFKCFKNISSLLIEVYGRNGILVHTKHKLTVIQLQINLQFPFTLKL